MNNSNNIYRWAISFKKRYPSTVAWRLKKHCQIAEKHLNDDETVLYVFTGQRNDNWYDIISTSVFVITDKRLIIIILTLYSLMNLDLFKISDSF